MKSIKKKSVVILFTLLFTIFRYSQYVSLSEISVSISENMIVNENNSNHKIELKFRNSSLLTLPAGETKFLYFMIMKLLVKAI